MAATTRTKAKSATRLTAKTKKTVSPTNTMFEQLGIMVFTILAIIFMVLAIAKYAY